MVALEFMATLRGAREALVASIRAAEDHATKSGDAKACVVAREILEVIAAEFVVPVTDELGRAYEALAQSVASRSQEVSA